ncbi:MAG: hypothetical protein LBT32_06975 [Peptococcaceae bacterium]|jgi:hypothetical protein|nr:hypothetical protein [Peptococcaceae bacterium]
MKVSEVAKSLDLRCCVPGEEDGSVTGGYIGDLLSWVIGRAGKGAAWITIMSTSTVAAVALLADVSMIILAEGVEPDKELADKAQTHGLALYSSTMGAYELSWRLHELIGESCAGVR